MRCYRGRTLAKKSRTPPPPRRPVQAPQRRSKTPEVPAERRRLLLPILFGISGIILVFVVVGVLTLFNGGKSSDAAAATALRAAGCTVKVAAATSRKHVTSLSAKIKYNTTPPSNGSHYAAPAIWDFYTTPANPIQVVHNEEHGGVILWWGNKVPSSTVDRMHAFYNESQNGMLGTPYPALGNKVAITAWTAPSGGLGEGHVAVCTTFNEDAFKKFRDAFRGKGPERFPVDSLAPGQ